MLVAILVSAIACVAVWEVGWQYVYGFFYEELTIEQFKTYLFLSDLLIVLVTFLGIGIKASKQTATKTVSIASGSNPSINPILEEINTKLTELGTLEKDTNTYLHKVFTIHNTMKKLEENGGS